MRYFVVSDVHSFFTPLITALNEKGFNKDKDTLIVCGDVFDRGNETNEVYDFIKSLPNKILIKGNHEYLYLQLLDKSFPNDWDFSNGTVRTFCSIAGVDERLLSRTHWLIENMFSEKNYDVAKELTKTWKKVVNKVKKSEITKWLKSDEWVNYYELKDYVFVHSWVPVNILDDLPKHYVNSRQFEPILNWREITDEYLWENATWGSPIENYKHGLWKENKCLVVGHWHSDLFHEEFNDDYSNNYDIYFGKNIIAIDGCTALSKRVNVLLIEE